MVYALKRAYIRAINLCCAKVSQPRPIYIICKFSRSLLHPDLNHLPDLCVGPNIPLHTQISVPTHRSILNYRSQHTTPHSAIGPNTPLHTQLSVPTHRSILNYRSQHTAPYSTIGPNTPLHTQVWVTLVPYKLNVSYYYFPTLSIRFMK